MAEAGEIRKKISIARAELDRVRINGKLTKKGKRNRAVLKKECKHISAAELVRYMEKQISLLRILKRGFYRRQKHEEARRVNHQFRVDAGQVYANMRERYWTGIKKMSAQSTRQLTTKMRQESCLRMSKMRAAIGYSSGKVKGRGIETPSGLRKLHRQFIAEFPLHQRRPGS